ncbi:MAG: polyprenol monophosphomannose synthase [Brevinema sp.]
MKGIVIVPTYNEAGNIERLIPQVLELTSLDILVVDDGSPDGTPNIVKEFSEFGTRIFMLERDKKEGLGRAYIAGFKKAMEMDCDFVIQMDADLSHNPHSLKDFVDHLESGTKVVVGSRYVGGVRVLDWDVKRLFLSICANVYAQWTTGVPCYDLTGGFNAYHKDVLNKILLDKITSKGYMFQIEMKSTAFSAGFDLAEVPILFVDRTIGETKLKGSIIYEAIIGCIMLRIKYITNTLPIK